MTRALANGRKIGDSTVVSIRFTNDEFARIRKVAEDQERSVCAVIRRLIRRGLPAEELEAKR